MGGQSLVAPGSTPLKISTKANKGRIMKKSCKDTKAVAFRINLDTYKKLSKLASSQHRSMTGQVTWLIEKAVSSDK